MAERLEGALASFLTRVLDEFAAQVASEGALRSAVAAWGVDGADADAAWAFVSAHAPAMGRLNASLPGLTAQLRSSNPDGMGLVRPVADLWSVVSGLADQAPTVTVPGVPGAGTVLDLLLGGAVDVALRRMNPAGWAFARAIRLVGPDVPVLDALGDLLEGPTAFLRHRFWAVRSNLDIAVSGLLTGPRTTSVVVTSADGDRQIAPDVAARLPSAAVVVGRVVVRLAADTFDEPAVITVEVVGDGGDVPAFVAVVVRTGAWPAPVRLGDHASLRLDRPASLGVALTGYGTLVPLADGGPALTLTSSFAPEGFALGDPGGLRLRFADPVLDATLGGARWTARMGVGTFELVIPATVAGPVLSMLLPSGGITLRGRLVAVADGDGLHLDGGIGLRATWPDTVRLPGLVVRDLTTEISVGDGFALSAFGTAIVSLGPVTVTIDGLGLRQPLRLTPDGSGNVGVVDLPAPALRPPTGFGVSIDAGILKGGGFLRVDGDEISGALELALSLGPLELGIRAVAVLGTVDGAVSFLVVLGVEFSPPIEIFMGLTLNAVGGVFGLNRTLDREALGALVRSGRMTDLMFPRDLAERAVEIIAAVKGVFPARRDQFVVGPMLQLGWGRPVSFVTLSVGVVFTFPRPAMVAIIGELRLALPADELALVDLRCGFAGGIDLDTGDVWFDASLERSTIGFFEVSGDLCLRAGSSGFVFSAGGFHPRFQPPAGIPAVRRLAISISPSPILEIRAEAYFAVTSSSLQFGARLFMSAELGPIGARGNLGLDVLFQTEPHFHFIAEISGSFSLTVFDEEICGLDLSVLLEGPGRWHARAHASIRLLFITVSGTLELAWGDAAPEVRPPVDVAARVREALAQDHVWAHVVPATDAGLVHLRDGATGLHPLGSLRLTQTVAPLGVALEKYGANPVTSAGPVVVTVTAAGTGTPVPQSELFAPAQFFSMTDDERLGKPQFVPYPAGYTVTGAAWLPPADRLTVDVVYEEVTGAGRDPVGSRHYAALDVDALGWSVTGAAGRTHAEGVDLAPPRRIAVEEVRYAVADALSGALLTAPGPTDVLAASMVRSADTVLVGVYETAGV